MLLIQGLCKCEIEMVWSVMAELSYEKRIGKTQASVLGEGGRDNRKKIPARGTGQCQKPYSRNCTELVVKNHNKNKSKVTITNK